MRKKLYLYVSLWIGISIFNFGAINANLQWEQVHRWPDVTTKRQEASFAMLMSLPGPFALPVSIFETGFLEHGWSAKW